MVNGKNDMDFVSNMREQSRLDSEYGRVWIVAAVALLVLQASALLSLSMGAMESNMIDVVMALFGQGDDITRVIVHEFRMPRIFMGIMVGAALGMAGALLQGVLRSPLVSPDLMGITSNAAASVATLVFFTSKYSFISMPIVAFAGALVAAFLLYGLSLCKVLTTGWLVLIGFGLSLATGGLTLLLYRLELVDSYYIVSRLLGNVSNISWREVSAIWPWMALMLPCALLLVFRSQGWYGNVSGEATGATGNISHHASKLIALLICAGLSGISAAFAGVLTFIGLLSPYLARLLIGRTSRAIAPLSALIGACLLLLSDLAARMLFSPIEIQAGLFTAAAGILLFVYLLIKNWKRR